MRILITAGPTREYFDAVRYLSNPSTGKMGFALARVARRLGHRPRLVTGPGDLPRPLKIDIVEITTAREMQQAVRRYFPESDCLIMAAAVSDYRPRKVSRGKVKKTRNQLRCDLVRNPDILKEISRHKVNQTLVGFALETRDFSRNARKKLRAKKLDYIVMNTPRAFGRDRVDAQIFNGRGCLKKFKNISKDKLSEAIIKLVEKNRRQS